jgi:alanine dehydrogenase
MAIAKKGWKKALRDDAALLRGLNIADGKVTLQALADEFTLPFHAPETFLG